jgi:hypothetical protein
VIRRRNAIGELFVSRIVVCPHDDFSSAVDDTKQKDIGLILGAEAEELLCRLNERKGSRRELTKRRKSGNLKFGEPANGLSRPWLKRPLPS